MGWLNAIVGVASLFGGRQSGGVSSTPAQEDTAQFGNEQSNTQTTNTGTTSTTGNTFNNSNTDNSSYNNSTSTQATTGQNTSYGHETSANTNVGTTSNTSLGSGSTQDSQTQTGRQNAQSTTSNYSASVLSGLDQLLGQTMGGSGASAGADAIAAQLGSLRNQVGAGGFDPAAYAEAQTRAAGTELKSAMNSGLSQMNDSLGATAGDNSMAALLASKLRGQTAAQLAGINSSALAQGTQIQQAQQQGLSSQIAALAGEQSDGLAALLGAARGGQTTTSALTQNNTNTIGSQVSNTAQTDNGRSTTNGTTDTGSYQQQNTNQTATGSQTDMGHQVGTQTDYGRQTETGNSIHTGSQVSNTATGNFTDVNGSGTDIFPRSSSLLDFLNQLRRGQLYPGQTGIGVGGNPGTPTPTPTNPAWPGWPFGQSGNN